MKEIQVPEIACFKAEAEAIPALFKSEHVPYQLIATVAKAIKGTKQLIETRYT